jgi:SAUR family protein
VKGNPESTATIKIPGSVLLEIIFSTSLGPPLELMMISGKRIGKLVKKFMRGVPEYGSPWANTRSLKRRWSGNFSISSHSWSHQSGESRSSSGSDSDDWDNDAPAGIPQGCFAVYVGPEMRRFVIHTTFLHKQVFRDLLKKTEEEYGFESAGGLRIACEAAVFEELLWQS